MANKYEDGSKVRLNRMCYRKLRYKTAAHAGPDPTRRAYRCPECGFWHRTKLPARADKVIAGPVTTIAVNDWTGKQQAKTPETVFLDTQKTP